MRWEEVRRGLVGLFTANLTLKGVAFLLMLVIYVWVSGTREVTEAMYAPVRLGVPQGYVLMSPALERIKVRVRGQWSDLSRFGDEQIEPIAVALSPADDNRVLQLSPDLVGLPPGLRALDVEPGRYQVRLARRSSKRVPVRPRVVGDPAAQHRVGRVTVEPAVVILHGPKEQLQAIEGIRTQSVDITSRAQTFTQRVRLELDDPRLEVEDAQPLRVRVELEVERGERRLEEVPVVAVDTTRDVEIRPRTTDVVVRGPLPAIEQMDPSDVYGAVDLSREEDRPPGVFQKSATIKNLPPDVELVEMHPQDFQVETGRRREAGDDDTTTNERGRQR